jgi:hypothetical protein
MQTAGTYIELAQNTSFIKLEGVELLLKVFTIVHVIVREIVCRCVVFWVCCGGVEEQRSGRKERQGSAADDFTSNSFFSDIAITTVSFLVDALCLVRVPYQLTKSRCLSALALSNSSLPSLTAALAVVFARPLMWTRLSVSN